MSSLYGRDSLLEAATDDDSVNVSEAKMTEYVQLIAEAEMLRLPDDTLRGLNEDGTLAALQERQVLNKKSMMRLSKADDEKRRVKLIAYKLAKDDGSAHYKKMVFHRGKWRQYRDEVLRRYGKKAKKLARIATKEYIKRAKKEPAAAPGAVTT